MKALSHKQLERQSQLRKLVRSLSKVSEIDTKDIRRDVSKAYRDKNTQRAKHYVENDKLLKDKKFFQSQQRFRFSSKLFEDVGKGSGGLKDKKLESEAAMKHADFQFRKFQAKKQRIAMKYRQFLLRFKEIPKITQMPLYYPIDITKIAPQDVFQDGDLAKDYELEDVQEEFIKRIKSTVRSSKLQMQNLYDRHCNSLRILSMSQIRPKRKKKKSPIKIITEGSKNTDLASKQIQKEASQQSPNSSPRQSVINTSKKNVKARSLIDLIRRSASRAQNNYEHPDEKLTTRQQIQYKHIDETIKGLKKDIEIDNNFKESVVYTGLKKILYGDRKAKLTKNSTLKTRVGQNTESYLNVLEEQNKIFDNFDGSYSYRRNLAEKFSDVLGMIKKSQRPLKINKKYDKQSISS